MNIGKPPRERSLFEIAHGVNIGDLLGCAALFLALVGGFWASEWQAISADLMLAAEVAQ